MEKIQSKQDIKIHGKEISLQLTNAALDALNKREKILVAEMELYFSCLIRKQVRFRENMGGDLVQVSDLLAVRFRPVMTESCGLSYEGDEPPLTDFPIKKPESFVPKWMKIDYRNNGWTGEFGY